MNTKNKLLMIFCGLMMSLIAVPARAQNAGGESSATPGQVREEVHQMINDLNDPNYDFSKFPDRMRQTFQDFRAATDGMDPSAAQQFRQEMFQQLMPVIQANQQKIQDAVRLAYLKSLQEPLGCSDDEFAAIRPYLEKVVNAWQATQTNRFRGPNGTQGQNNRPPAATTSDVQKAAGDLQETLADPDANPDLIKTKLDILRQAQDKAKQDLTVARSQLQALLTERQEAVLVEYGLLD
jgi:hypothetical protein